MGKATSAGTVYRARSHDRHLNRRLNLRLLSGIASAVALPAGVAVVALLVHPPLLGWFL